MISLIPNDFWGIWHDSSPSETWLNSILQASPTVYVTKLVILHLIYMRPTEQKPAILHMALIPFYCFHALYSEEGVDC